MIKANSRPPAVLQESLKWVCYHGCTGWRQAVVYRRKAANFHRAEDRSGQPPLAVSEREWTLYVWHVCTCNGSRVGAPKPENCFVCMHPPTLSPRRLMKMDQNATFTFVTLKEKGKKNATQKLHPQMEDWKHFKGRTVHFSSFYRLLLKFYKHSQTKRIMEDVLQSTKYMQTAVAKFCGNNLIFRVVGVASSYKFRKYSLKF